MLSYVEAFFCEWLFFLMLIQLFGLFYNVKKQLPKKLNVLLTKQFLLKTETECINISLNLQLRAEQAELHLLLQATTCGVLNLANIITNILIKSKLLITITKTCPCEQL